MDKPPQSSSPLNSYLVPLVIAALIGIVLQFRDWKLWLVTFVGVFIIWLMIIGRNAPGNRSRKITRALTANELMMDNVSLGDFMKFHTACPVCEIRNEMPWGKLKAGVALNCRGCGTPLLITRQGNMVTIETNVLRRHRQSHPEVQYCTVCGRPVQNLGQGGELLTGSSSVIFDSSALIAGLEGPGDECQRCGRIYCTKCARTDAECVCGSKTFRVVRLRYLDKTQL
jgi:hypothetical protein